jgi:hypothetical protein
LRWWIEEWAEIVRDRGGFFPADVLDYIPDTEPEPTYAGRHWQIARAEVARVLRRAGIGAPSYFDGKFVVEIGPGPMGFPNACPAASSVAVEPLADLYRQHDLLLEDGAVYLTAGAEQIPLVSRCADVVVSKNSLDHVTDPAAVVGEVHRILKPGGEFILDVDTGHPRSPTEPHTFSASGIRDLLDGFEIISKRLFEAAHGGEGRAIVFRARTRPGLEP